MSSQEGKKQKFSIAIRSGAYQNLINSTLGDPERAKRFVASVSSAVGANPDLQDCDARSIITAALLGESLNLSPSPQLGQYYMVPFKNKRTGDAKAQFVLGYKGYIQLALRSGQYADLDVLDVKEGEYKGRDPYTGKQKFLFIEDDGQREDLPTVGYLAYFEYLNGFRKAIYWTRDKVMSHAGQYSQAFRPDKYEDYINGRIPQNELWKYSSDWYKNFDSMSHKTLLRQLISKWGVMSLEMQQAIEADGSLVERTPDGALVAEEPAALLPEEPSGESLPEPAPQPEAGTLSLDQLLEE